LDHYADEVAHVALIDPVTLLLAVPDVAYNFVYRPPTTLREYFIRIMASRELTISHTLHRKFWWYQNNLWLEDVPLNTGIVVGLSAEDEVLNSLVIHEYILKCSEQRMRLCSSLYDSRRNLSSKSLLDSHQHCHECKDISPIMPIYWPTYGHGTFLFDTYSIRSFVDALVKNEDVTLQQYNKKVSCEICNFN
jgi:hypothetical protein